MGLSALRRPDWLAEIQHALAASLVFVASVGVGGLVLGLTGAPIDVPLSAGAALSGPAPLRDGLRLAPDAAGPLTVRVADPDGGQTALHLLGLAPRWGVCAVMLFLLWRLVRAARRSESFTPENVRRLRWVGWLLVIGGPVSELVSFAASFALTGTLGHAEATLTLVPTATWLLGGLGMLAVSEVVRHGLALRTELDAVV